MIRSVPQGVPEAIQKYFLEKNQTVQGVYPYAYIVSVKLEGTERKRKIVYVKETNGHFIVTESL